MPEEDYERLARSYDFFLEKALVALRKAVVESCAAPGNPKVLEVACGTGSQARYFSDRGFDYRGIDISEPMLAVARAKGMNCLAADGTSLPFRGGEFDAATVSLALHETPPVVRVALVSEMVRVVRPGGALVLADYTVPPRQGPAAWVNGAAIFAIERFVGGDHYRNYRDFMASGGLVGFMASLGLEAPLIRYVYGGNMGVCTVINGGAVPVEAGR